MSKSSSTVPTHRDIAKAAGVAVSTVSLALRKDHRVAERTAAKIRAAAEKLGYRANPSVAMWMAHVRSTRSPRFQEAIAYIHTIPPEHSYRRYVPFDEYRKGAGERAKRLGYQLRDFEWHDKGMTSPRLRRILEAQGIRGVIFEYSDFEERQQTTLDFDWSGLSAISLGAPPSDIPIHNVSSDCFGGAMVAYEKLVSLGYSRIGMSLHTFSDRSIDYEISGGFLCAQSLHPAVARIPVHNIDVVQGWDRQGFCEWYERYQPDAVVSPNKEILDFMKHLGLKAPADIGWANLIKPTGSDVTGLDHHPEQIGSVAVDLLSSVLCMNETGKAEFIRRELIEPTWCEGTTVRAVGAPVAVPIRTRDRPLRVYSRNLDWRAAGQDRDSGIR